MPMPMPMPMPRCRCQDFQIAIEKPLGGNFSLFGEGERNFSANSLLTYLDVNKYMSELNSFDFCNNTSFIFDLISSVNFKFIGILKVL